jgi:hypothetical protein
MVQADTQEIYVCETYASEVGSRPLVSEIISIAGDPDEIMQGEDTT